MLRGAVGTVHVLLAVLLLLQGLLFVAQGQLNVAWEDGFYGARSPATTTLVVAGWASVGIAAFVALSGAGFLARAPAAGWGLLVVGLVLVLFAPGVWRVLGGVTLVSVTIDRWRRRPPPEEDAS